MIYLRVKEANLKKVFFKTGNLEPPNGKTFSLLNIVISKQPKFTEQTQSSQASHSNPTSSASPLLPTTSSDAFPHASSTSKSSEEVSSNQQSRNISQQPDSNLQKASFDLNQKVKKEKLVTSRPRFLAE